MFWQYSILAIQLWSREYMLKATTNDEAYSFPYRRNLTWCKFAVLGDKEVSRNGQEFGIFNAHLIHLCYKPQVLLVNYLQLYAALICLDIFTKAIEGV